MARGKELDDMEFNRDLWEERWRRIDESLSDVSGRVDDLRIFLFGNGKTDDSLAACVKANTKFREEWESMIHEIQRDLIKKMFFAVLALTFVTLGGLGTLGYAMYVMINSLQ